MRAAPPVRCPRETALLCCLLALGCGDAAGSGVTEPPRPDDSDPIPPGSTDVRRVDVPAEAGGGQSGSMGSSSEDPCKPLPPRTVGELDEALEGYPLEVVDGWLMGTYYEPLALYWYVGREVPTRIELSFSFEPSAVVTEYRKANQERCPWKDGVVQRGTLHVTTSDGLLDAEVEAEFHFGLNVAVPVAGFENLIPLDALGGPLAGAITEALAIAGVTQPFTGISVQAVPSLEHPTTQWELELDLAPFEPGSSNVFRIARGVLGQGLPAARVGFEPTAELVGACEQDTAAAMQAAATESPGGLEALAGTWLLCGGDHPASVTIEHAGIRIDDQGHFTLLAADQGQLVERSGFGRQGQVQEWPIDAYTEFSQGLSQTLLDAFLPITRTELLISDDLGPRGFRGLFELTRGGSVLRFRPDTDFRALDPLDLVHVKTSLPVLPAVASPFAPGELAGAEGCAVDEHTVRPATLEDASHLQGTLAWCAGSSRGAVQLTLGTDGTFRDHDPQDQVVRDGTYALVTDPVNLYSDGVAELVLTASDGSREILALLAVSETPYKLLLTDYRWSSDGAEGPGPDRYVIVSPMP